MFHIYLYVLGEFFDYGVSNNIINVFINLYSIDMKSVSILYSQIYRTTRTRYLQFYYNRIRYCIEFCLAS